MNYYFISEETNYRKTGSYQQIRELTIRLNKAILDSFGKLELSRDIFCGELPPLDKFKLAEEAVITDMLSFKYLSTNVGFLLSSGFKDILEESALSDHKYYPVNIEGLLDTWRLNETGEKDNKLLKYFFLHLIEDRTGIDYNKSEFHKCDFFDKPEGEPLIVKDRDDFHRQNHYIQKNSPGKLLRFTGIVINKQLDMFRLPGNPRIMVSEELKQKLEKNNISGIKFELAKTKISIS